MADSYIQLPADGVGKKLDTDQITVGAETVHRERDRIAGAAAAEIADVKNSDPAGTHYGMVVRVAQTVSPVTDSLSSADLAAGSSADLNATLISAGNTGKLLRVFVASSVACKWVIKSVDGVVETTIGVAFTGGLSEHPTFLWEPPTKDFDTLAYGDGNERFRVTVTNLDQQNAADVYATVYWDEV